MVRFCLEADFHGHHFGGGVKGGEIVPTFCIGATFGCVVGSVLGLVGLFCCATNSPISSVFLGVELFGLGALPYYVLICLILWPLSVDQGLFKNRMFRPVKVLRRKENAG